MGAAKTKRGIRMSAKNTLKVVEEPTVDPMRTELSICIADRAARFEQIASCRNAVDRLHQVVEKIEDRQSLASVSAEQERSDQIRYLAETAQLRLPENTPLSPARRALA